MIIPTLFIEVISDKDKVKIEQRSVERHRDLESKEKQMKNLNKRLKDMKSKKKIQKKNN